MGIFIIECLYRSHNVVSQYLTVVGWSTVSKYMGFDVGIWELEE